MDLVQLSKSKVWTSRTIGVIEFSGCAGCKTPFKIRTEEHVEQPASLGYTLNSQKSGHGNFYSILMFLVFLSPRGPLTMSPFLGQARPFCTNFPWFCRFFGPPSANLQSKGSDGAAKREGR